MARAVVSVNTEMQAVSRKISSSQTWMLLNSKGQSLIIEVDKYAIMHRVGIHARDLRILDPLLSYPSTILGRERAIVLNLEHIKAIITAEEVLLRDPTDEKVVPFVEELCRRLSAKKDLDMNSKSGAEGSFVEDEPPFEFRALEVALEAVCSFLDARTTELATVIHPALDELVEKVSSCNLDKVRKLKSRMTRLTARAQKVRDELEQLLDDDSDMADLFLTRKLASAASPAGGSPEPQWVAGSPTIGSRISRASKVSGGTYGSDNDVEQLEMLLEAYFMQIDSTLNRLLTLREYIDDTEDYINIQLDNHRNQLIQLELVLSAGTVVLAMFASVAGIFGMNIPYPWNKGYNYVFKWVVIFTGIMCTACFSTIILYAHHKGLIG